MIVAARFVLYRHVRHLRPPPLVEFRFADVQGAKLFATNAMNLIKEARNVLSLFIGEAPKEKPCFSSRVAPSRTDHAMSNLIRYT